MRDADPAPARGAEGVLKGAGLLMLLLLAAGALALYWPALDARPYGDDNSYVFDPPPSSSLEFFVKPNPYQNFYRPLGAAIHAEVARRAGATKLPVHALVLALHVLLCWLVVRGGRRLGWSRLEAGLAGLIMLVSQANALAVASVDGLSQVGATLCVYLGLYSLWLAAALENGSTMVRGLPWAGSMIAFGTALLFKETGAGFITAAAGILAILGWRSGGVRAIVRRLALLWPHAVILTGYLALRASVLAGKEPPVGGRYGLEIGPGIVENLLQLAFASLTPSSTVSVFLALRTGNTAAGAAHALATLLLVGAVTWGILRSPRAAPVPLLLLVALLVSAPVIALRHVSELYAYGLMPCVALAMGLGLGSLFRGARRAAWRVPVAAGLLLLFLAHATATRDKAARIRANGERAAELIPAIAARVPEVPRGGALHLLNAPGEGPEYSVFVCHGFNVLRDGLYRIQMEAGRRDFGIYLLQAGEWDAAPPNPAGVVRLTLEDVGHNDVR